MFLPTFLECFSASYAEAMLMKKPIITSNLGFAQNVCKDAAVYFDPCNPEDIIDKIFVPNFTTKTSGSGLGLAMVKQIITAHDGDITFSTE